MQEKIQSLIAKFNIQGFFHFTDTRNIESIQTNGILSQKQMKARNLVPVSCGGNEISQGQAERMGLDDYVSLCFRPNHPLEYLARERGDIKVATYLHILPQILDTEGLMYSEGVSNSSSSKIVPMSEAIDIIDFEVLYTRTDWTDSEIQKRLRLMERSELLVPKIVPLKYIYFPTSSF